MKAEDQIIEAVEHIINKTDIKLVRGGGAVFDWTKLEEDEYGRIRPVASELPTKCDALGALLIFNNKQHLAGPGGFDPNWLKEVCALLNENELWVWRFNHGWGHGHELNFEIHSEKDGKKQVKKETDKTSRWANKLARKYIK